MTALNVVIHSECVHLISDGRATGPDGLPAHLTHKVVPLPHLSAAVGVRGALGMRHIAVEIASGCATSFDGLRTNLAATLRAAFALHEAGWLKQYGPDFLKSEIVVAGWSELRGPTGFIVATSDMNAAYGLPAWTPVDVGGAYFSPGGDDLVAEFTTMQLGFTDARAVELIRRQGELRTNVGDFVQSTSVFADRIETRILKNWKA